MYARAAAADGHPVRGRTFRPNCAEHGAKSRYAQYTAMDMMDAYFNGKKLADVKKSRWGK